MTSRNLDISRRRLLQLMGIGAVSAAGVTSLTACKADSPDSGGDGGTFTTAYDFDVTSQNYNAIIADTTLLMASPFSELFYPRSALLNWGDNSWVYMLAESSTWDGDVLNIKYRTGIKWSDDTDFTIDDVLGSFRVAKLNTAPGADGWAQVTAIDKVDDTTVAVTFTEPYPGLEREILRSRIHATSRYGEHFATAEQLVTDGVVFDDPEQQEFVSVLGELSFEDFVTCGAFAVDAATVSDTRITMNLHEGGLFADQVKFDKVVVVKASNDEAAQLVAERKVDYITHVLGPAERAQFEGTEGLVEMSFVDKQGTGLMLNNKSNPEFEDYRVRKALLHAIDKQQVGQIALGDGAFFVPQYMSGLSDVVSESILTADELAKFDPYEYDLDKATAYLEDAGWTKDGDAWLKPDGEPAEYEILAVNGWNDFDLTAQQVAEQWNAFGIKAVTHNADEASIWGIWPAGDFQVAVRQWGNPFIPGIHGAWQMNWFTDNNRTEDTPGMWLETEEVETEAYGTVDIREIYDTARMSQDEAERTEANKKLAVIFNETLPRLPIWGFNRLSFGVTGVGVGEFAVDSTLKNNDIYQDNPVMISVLNGDIGPA
ncbi:peptide/nickel transport system substrate-binding protein [Stackebrandtia albiflava]|uniref:Peptide/nickel transport system substrate-binding protein n=1 Tax=Stackebrandtia albiflava TaxID=406432 RepID=A0A562UY24_9ACTN|nr:ABC transporter substrate-binding protein [Stackebrandtia albiflava]TWJ10515.1 peptide/nickel transport system substrate-binding protein [Stackebrandtia albiflava]